MPLDFQKGVPFKIEGELGKTQTLPLNVLIEIGKNLQELVNELAKANISETAAIDLAHFQIELSGFYKSSAVPEFVFSPRERTGNLTEDIVLQKTKVSDAFEDLMILSQRNDYENIKSIYKSATLRNPIVESLAKFTNSFGDSPVAVGEHVSDKEIKPKYTIVKISPERKSKLITAIIEPEPVIAENTFIGKFKQKSKNGKLVGKLKPVEVFHGNKVELAYAPDEIEFNGKKYLLDFPLRCLIETEDGVFSIKSEMLDLIGTGETEEQAKESFAQEFDYIYRRYSELAEDQMTKRLQKVKTRLLNLIKSVE